jgi:hypothetical protein
MTIPNTATTQVGYLITTEWGLSPFNAYQVSNVAPYVFGRARNTFAGVVESGSSEVVDGPFDAPADSVVSPVVSPTPPTPAPDDADEDKPSADDLHDRLSSGA